MTNAPSIKATLSLAATQLKAQGIEPSRVGKMMFFTHRLSQTAWVTKLPTLLKSN